MYPNHSANNGSFYQPAYFEGQPKLCYTPESSGAIKGEKENHYASLKASTPNAMKSNSAFHNISVGYSLNQLSSQGMSSSYGSVGWSPHTPKSDLDQSMDMNQTGLKMIFFGIHSLMG